MLRERLDPALRHLYDGVLDDSVHERYTALCRRLQAEHPELFAAVLAVFYGSGRAAVRRGFYAQLEPQAVFFSQGDGGSPDGGGRNWATA